jgi:hypothetical protein
MNKKEINSVQSKNIGKQVSEFYDIPLYELENGTVSSNEVVTENITVDIEDGTHNIFSLVFVSFLIGFGSLYFIYKMT